MEPAPLGIPEWREISSLLTALWMVVLFIVLFAANMIVGHNLIPSFVASRHIPQSWQRLRLFFYAAAIACFAIAVFFLIRTIDLAGVLRSFWADYWI